MKKEAKVVTLPYTPRPLQAEIHIALANGGSRVRFAVLAIHRRFGKTVAAVTELVNATLTCVHPNPRCFYVAPTYKQAKSIAWEYVKDMTRPIPGMKFLETELIARFPNGGRIQLLGAENYDSMRGNYVDAVVLDEYGNMNPLIWREVIRPALADRLGWVLFLGTPNGKNHFYDIYEEGKRTPGWLVRTYRADKTRLIAPEELAAARLTMGEEEYRQEFLCDWMAAIRGSYYALECQRVKEEGRLCTVPHAAILPVDVAFDLGMDDATAVWFVQCVGREVRLMDYREWKNTGLNDILLEMSRMPYLFGTAILPHDAQVRELSTGRTRVETFESSSLFQSVEVAARLKIEDGVNAVRQLLPLCYFDAQNAKDGFDALENYRKVFDAKLGEYRNTPVHDKYSHGADSFRYLAVHYHPTMGEVRDRALGRGYKSTGSYHQQRHTVLKHR
jgi:phage terminase large subunit